MPIKVACKCGQKFAAKDELAGRTVKCPKCGDPITIPAGASQPATQAPAAPQRPAQAAQKPQEEDSFRLAAETERRPIADPFMADLLVEAGVTSDLSHAGPRCPGCNAPIQQGAVLCVKCGFDFRTGHRLKSQVGPSSEFAHLSHGANAEELIRIAEEQIAETPIETGSDDGGDILMATLLAAGATVVTLIMVGLGYILFRWIDVSATSAAGIALIMFLIGGTMQSIGAIWLTVLAFMEDTVQGLLVLFCPCYIFYFCFTHLSSAGVPVMFFLVGFVMNNAGGAILAVGDSSEEGVQAPVVRPASTVEISGDPANSPVARVELFAPKGCPLMANFSSHHLEVNSCDSPFYRSFTWPLAA